MSMQALCIEPQSTVEITLLPMSGHTGSNGYMYAHPSLDMCCFSSYFNCICICMIATMLRCRRATNNTVLFTTCSRRRSCVCIHLTLHVFFFDDSLAQATFRIERVDHKLNFAGESASSNSPSISTSQNAMASPASTYT